MQAGVDLIKTGTSVHGQPIELVDEFCYLGCMLKNKGSHEKDIQQRCAKAVSALKPLTKYLWSNSITNEVMLRVYLSAIRSIMMYGSETSEAPSTVMERFDCTERKTFNCKIMEFHQGKEYRVQGSRGRLDGCFATFGLGHATMKSFTRKSMWCTAG
ncbi:hypothetical protein RB195_020028 [Necator americanus]|uniref:Uncharacterized protein n=1 Tax=Necator americanus TaxID=51031 RepID=A0ABR1CGW4_NECAM